MFHGKVHNKINDSGALDKKVYLVIIWDNCSYFCIKTYVVTPHLNHFIKAYVVTPHLNHLNEMIQMRGHNICFNAELTYGLNVK